MRAENGKGIKKQGGIKMPRGDGTGPEGLGPMTGRAAGYCAGYDRPGFTNPGGRGLARGWGRGLGRGIGWRRGGWRGYGYFAPAYYRPPVTITPEEEKAALENEIDLLKKETEALQKRLSELDKG